MVTLRPALTLGPHRAESFFTPSLIRACLANRDGHRTADHPARDLPEWEATLSIEERPARSMAWQREARDHAPSAGR